jgi:hypothetical protein
VQRQVRKEDGAGRAGRNGRVRELARRLERQSSQRTGCRFETGDRRIMIAGFENRRGGG